MSHISNVTESGILSHLFRTDTLAKPSTIAVALTGRVPADSDTGASMGEISNANNYARVNMGAPSNGIFNNIAQDALGSGYITNVSVITFNQCTGSEWGWSSGIAILDSAGYGSGNILYAGPLPTAQLIQVGTTFSIPAGGLQIALS